MDETMRAIGMEAHAHCQAGQCGHLRALFGMGCSGPNRKDKRHACIHPSFGGDLRIIPPPEIGNAPWTPTWCPLKAELEPKEKMR